MRAEEWMSENSKSREITPSLLQLDLFLPLREVHHLRQQHAFPHNEELNAAAP